MESSWSIGALAGELGVTTRTMRFYEAEGLIAPLRDGRRRIYGTRERARLKLILRGRRLGFRLAEIREIIDLYDAPLGEAWQLRHMLGRIAERRDELARKRTDIDHTLDDLAAVAAKCSARLSHLGHEPGNGKRE